MNPLERGTLAGFFFSRGRGNLKKVLRASQFHVNKETIK